ncbi:MAG: hypothetical protein MUO68_11945 [Desulfobacteraceae bacterium]|jgi:hypothetical protein|nr:hypothetical protein [Desulfobacteraceae bacterium]
MHLNKSYHKEAWKRLLSDFEGVLPWKWEKNFEAPLAEFSAKDQEKVCSILKRHLSLKWDSDTIRKAPDIVKTNTGHLGDLRRGQMLFTSDPEGKVFNFAA